MASRGVYRSLFSALFDDPDFQHLSQKARLTLLTLRLCKQAGPAAIFRYYLEPLAAQTGLAVKDLKGALSELSAGGWVIFDTVVVWVRNGLRYDPMVNLANARQRKGVERAIAELPRSNVVLRFCDYYEIAKPYDSLTIGYEGPTSPNTDTPILRNTETETETESPPTPPGGTWPSPECLVELYNTTAPDECPAVTKLSPSRRKKAQAYLAMFPDRTFWEETFAQIRVSRFLRGLRPASNGHERFVADFDWLLTKGKDGTENCVKTYEGKYHD